MRASDPRAREILDRSEALSPEELMRLHGRTVRECAGAPMSSPAGTASRAARRGRSRSTASHVGRGSLVRLRPARAATSSTSRWPARRRSSSPSSRTSRAACASRWSSRTTRAATSAWRGSPGTASSSRASEVEPLGPPADPRRRTRPGRRDRQRLPRRRRLRRRGRPAAGRSASCPPGVKVADFGIRGMDLAYELQEDYDAAVLVDAVPRGGEPGTLYVIEPEPRQARRAVARRARDGPRAGARAGAHARLAAAARAGRRLRAGGGR